MKNKESYDPNDAYQNFEPVEIDDYGDATCPFCEHYLRINVERYDYQQYENDMVSMDVTCPVCGELFPAIARIDL